MATSSDEMGAGSTARSTPPTSKPRKERTSMCSYCGMTFNKKEHLQRHERTHTLDRPYHCDFPGCGKAFARRDTLTRHTRLHQRDEVQGSLKVPLGHGLGDDDETSEAFTTPSGSKQVSPATSGSTAPGPPSAAILAGKGKKATHSRTGSIASQKSSRRGSGSKGPSSHPNSKKNTPEYKTAAEERLHQQQQPTPTAAIRNRPRRAAAAALYDENALMDEDASSEQDEMQEDSGNDQDHMVIPAEVKPDLEHVNSALAPVIGQTRSSSHGGGGNIRNKHEGAPHGMEDMIKPLLPSLHTSSYLARSLEARNNQGIPHVKSGHANPVPATAIAGLNQPIYNFASWDHNNAYGGNQPNPTLVAGQGNGNNPALLGYSSSANSSGSSSGSTYNSSHSQIGSGGSASLASPYSLNGAQVTPGSALGLDLGLPPSPAIPILPTPNEVQHFQGFHFPGNNNNTTSSPAGGNHQQQQYRSPPYASGQEGFPSFQGPTIHPRHNSFNNNNSSAASSGGAIAGSQGYPNQSPSTAAQSFLASSPGSTYSPHLSQREPIDSTSSLNATLSSSAPSATQSYIASSAPAVMVGNNGFNVNANASNNNNNGSGASYRRKAPSFVPSFWAHMTVQHQDHPTSGSMPAPQNFYSTMHRRSTTSASFSPTDDGFELLSNHSDTSSPISAPSSLLSTTSPTLTTSMNLYSLTSPASEVSALPSLSSSFSSAFSGDFFAGAGSTNGEDGNGNQCNNNNNAFKHSSSFMEPLMSLDPASQTMNAASADLNAAILKAADAHTDQFINWPERETSPFAFPGLSPENAFSAPSVNTHSPSSATSYLDLSDYDNTQTSLFGDQTFRMPMEVAQHSSSTTSASGTAAGFKFGGCAGDFNDAAMHNAAMLASTMSNAAYGRQSPVSSLEDWLIRQTSGNEYVY